MQRIKAQQLINKTASAGSLSDIQSMNTVVSNNNMRRASLIPNTQAVAQSNATTEAGNNKEYAAKGFLPQRTSRDRRMLPSKSIKRKKKISRTAKKPIRKKRLGYKRMSTK
tara:strand:- start:4377 stop:4709 length:333 start_codon:yes stop_codon:yes gene_type:complete